jgi:SAM-dependent methyltransferase
MMAIAAERWRQALAAWAIPEEILAKAPESPYFFPTQVFLSRADLATKRPSVSSHQALAALPGGGVVLDVGCGAGAAALQLAARASRLIGVDSSRELLDGFMERASATGAEVLAIEGRWPDVADDIPEADVVVCHHVMYNTPDLVPFVSRLTDHARNRVVVEMTLNHPLAPMNDLWLRFHDHVRPTGPTADDAMSVLEEAGLEPEREDWIAPRPGGWPSRADLVATIRRQLCLTPDRDLEIDEAISNRILEREGRVGFPDRTVATIWWDGTAADRPGH